MLFRGHRRTPVCSNSTHFWIPAASFFIFCSEDSVVSGRGHQDGSEYAIIFGFGNELVDLELKWCDVCRFHCDLLLNQKKNLAPSSFILWHRNISASCSCYFGVKESGKKFGIGKEFTDLELKPAIPSVKWNRNKESNCNNEPVYLTWSCKLVTGHCKKKITVCYSFTSR